MIKAKITGAKEMARDLVKMRKSALPYAMRNFLNTAAFETRRLEQLEIQRTFVVRNQYTVGSVRVEQARGLVIRTMESRVGSIAPYMAVQESGGTVHGKGGHKPIPAPVAAGLAPGSTLTRLVRSRFRLGAIQVAHPSLHGGRKQQNAIAIASARKAGKNLVLLTRPSGGRGLFIVGSGKRSLRPRLLWDMSRSSVHIKAEPTLQRSLAAVRPKLQHMLEAALKQQLQRFNLPGY